DADGVWKANAWVKEGILAAFKWGVPSEFASGALSFIDKDTMPARRFKVADGIRIVPGGSSIRRGAYIGKGVVLMPPAYVNVGAPAGDSVRGGGRAGRPAAEGRVRGAARAVDADAGDREVSRRSDGQRDGARRSVAVKIASRLDGIELSLIRQINALATPLSVN